MMSKVIPSEQGLNTDRQINCLLLGYHCFFLQIGNRGSAIDLNNLLILGRLQEFFCTFGAGLLQSKICQHNYTKLRKHRNEEIQLYHDNRSCHIQHNEGRMHY